MRALVVYESMFGNTHAVAEAIGRGLADTAEVTVVPVGQATQQLVEAADLVVVGGPTHVHGMTRPSTRKAAVEQAGKEPDLDLDPDAAGEGVREWLGSLSRLGGAAAAFDTRAHAPAAFTGRASKGIERELRKHGLRAVAQPESFLVDKENHLEPGEEERAEEWGARLVTAVANPQG
jgi:hypothetical protein